jgi:hypothetical protein
MGGSTRTVSFETSGGIPTELDFNPCAHPGGSDLPGTEAMFTASLFEGESGEPVSLEQILAVLGPDETPPSVTINSDPPNKSQVEPGDEIVLDATALEHGFADWQEGLNSFKLIAKPGGPVGDEQRSEAGSPQPCGRKQWNLATQATYHVPDGAPPIIKICGEALDFAGNFSDPEACNEYYTGEVWEGTFTYDYSGPTLTCYADYSVTFGVSEGEVAGDITLGSSSCPGATAGGRLTGTKTDTAFAFEASSMGSGEFAVPITNGTTASATFSSVPEEIRVFDVRCVSCGS